VKAEAKLRSVHPNICPNEGFVEQLILFEMMGFCTRGKTTYHRKYRDVYLSLKMKNHKRKLELEQKEKEEDEYKRGRFDSVDEEVHYFHIDDELQHDLES